MYLVILNHRDTIEFTLNTDCDAFIDKLITQTTVHMQKVTIYSHLAYVSTYDQLIEQHKARKNDALSKIDDLDSATITPDINATPF